MAIEPRARHDVVPGNAIVELEFNDLPPPEIQFPAEDDGNILIYLNREHIKIRINGEERDFGFGERVPPLPSGMLW